MVTYPIAPFGLGAQVVLGFTPVVAGFTDPSGMLLIDGLFSHPYPGVSPIDGTDLLVVGGTDVLTFSAAPVPEPQTGALLLAGLALVGGLARRRGQLT
jgi:hypothetical protein